MSVAPAVRSRLYLGAVVIAGAAAALRLWFALERLLFPVHRFDAGDLGMRWREVQAWFSGQPVYGRILTADYPPASYPVFWPFIGWVGFDHARWIWAALTLALLIWLTRLLVRGSLAPRGLARSILLFLPCIGYATYSTIVNGQASLMVVTCLTAGVLTLAGGRGWRRDVAGALLVLVSLIKPTLSIPVVWVAFLAPQRVRPAVLIVLGYIALTLLGAAFQPVGLIDLIHGWLDQRDQVAAVGLDLQALLASSGLREYFLVALLAVVAATGWWVHRHRRVDVWLLLGATSIVAMLWSYHRPYDDVLMWLPTVALMRIAFRAPPGRERIAAGALACVLAVLALERLQLPWGRPTHGLRFTHVEAAVYALNNVRFAVWLAALAFLVREAHHASSPRAAMADRPAATAGARHSLPLLPPVDARGTGRWIAMCLGLVVLVLSGAFAWLAVDHRTLALWNVVVHESGHYTLGQTVFYVRHFLREIPTVLAMALFLISAYGTPPARRRDGAVPAAAALWVPALLAAGLVVAVTVTLVSLDVGPREAALNFSQLYTRDDVSAYGSHWRFHWLSTLWFGLAVPATAWVGHRFFRGPVPAGSAGAAGRRMAWLYFLGLTVIFGVGTEPFLDPRFIGHQAREIFTHAITTLPLGLGLMALVHRTLGAGPGPAPPERQLAARFIALAAIPAYLVAGTLLGDAMATGQTERGLAAMVAAHFFEHSLDFVLAASLVVGCQAIRPALPAVLSSLRSVLARP